MLGSYWRARLRSLGHALRGVGHGLRSQPHLRIHAGATAAVVGLALWLRVEAWEACALAVCVGQVWAAELLNSAIEELTDLVSPQRHTRAGRVKDLAAAAVLAVSITSALVAAVIFGRRLLE